MSLSPDEIRSDDYMRPNHDWEEHPVMTPGVGADDDAVIRKSSLRRKRRIFTIGFTAFSLGTLLILFNSPYRNEFLAPGPLSSSHAQILKGEGADRCSACHDAGHQSFGGWIATLLNGPGPDHVGQSRKCMECHRETMDPLLATLPHNQPEIPTEQAKHTPFQNASFSKNAISEKALGRTLGSPNEIACRACHREHHGNSDLRVLTDRQCQTCHSNVYHSFETDHPEFTNWPFPTGSSIAFDHASHSAKHFPEKGESFACAQCHVDDNFKNVKLLNDFETSCARCHDQPIRASMQTGLALIELPMLDMDAFKEAKLNIGAWPESAAGDFDGAIPELMRILLVADDQARDAFQSLGSDFQFADVDLDDSDQLQQVGEVVWAIKRLLAELAEGGTLTIKARLEKVAGRELTEREWRLLSGALDPLLLQGAIKHWLPELKAEVAGRESGIPFVQVANAGRSRILANLNQDDPDLLATNPLKSLMKTTSDSGLKPLIRHGQPQQPETDSKLPESSGAQREQIPDPKQSSRVIANPNSETLAENPLKRLMRQRVDPSTEIVLPEVTNVAPTETPRTPEVESGIEAKPIAPGNASVAPEFVVPRSDRGWVRDDARLQIRYQPEGHEDPFLQGWMEVLGSIPNVDQDEGTRLVFDRFTSLNGPGLCRSCHTMDRRNGDSFVVNWLPRYRDPSIRSFTRFSHGSHLVQPELRDCTACHELDLTRSNAESFVDFNPLTTVSNFRAIVKADCASCHREGQTNNSCTQCHSYHVGSRVSGSGK